MIANGDLPLEDIITHTLPLKDYRKGIEKVSFLYLSLTLLVEGGGGQFDPPFSFLALEKNPRDKIF